MTAQSGRFEDRQAIYHGPVGLTPAGLQEGVPKGSESPPGLSLKEHARAYD